MGVCGIVGVIENMFPKNVLTARSQNKLPTCHISENNRGQSKVRRCTRLESMVVRDGNIIRYEIP